MEVVREMTRQELIAENNRLRADLSAALGWADELRNRLPISCISFSIQDTKKGYDKWRAEAARAAPAPEPKRYCKTYVRFGDGDCYEPSAGMECSNWRAALGREDANVGETTL